jgi:deazaflavin-dependent oxidoreductase (nitroreductase family)
MSEKQSSASKEEVPQWISDHLRRYEEAPAEGHLWDATAPGGYPNTPTLLLTTTGRKSGKQITMPLIYGKEDDRYIIVASKGGAPQHPAWYLNLQANPQVDVQVVEEKFRAIARTATGEERQRMWQLMSAIYPPYPDYQKRTEREIPVVVLEKKK